MWRYFGVKYATYSQMPGGVCACMCVQETIYMYIDIYVYAYINTCIWKRGNDKQHKILTIGEFGLRLFEYSLYYFHSRNCPLSMKLFPNFKKMLSSQYYTYLIHAN